jgi:hypothetical protein
VCLSERNDIFTRLLKRKRKKIFFSYTSSAATGRIIVVGSNGVAVSSLVDVWQMCGKFY